MAKHVKKPRRAAKPLTGSEEIPPGATRKAFDRPLDPGGGPPGSAAGTRHAADDVGTDDETFGRTDAPRTPASEPPPLEDPLERGPPYAGSSGGAVGGFPAQLRSVERPPADEPQAPPSTVPERSEEPRIPHRPEAGMKRLTGFEAIEYAEKQGLSLNKHPSSITGPRAGLTVPEAEAIADDDPDLIWLDVSEEDYYTGPPSSYEPER